MIWNRYILPLTILQVFLCILFECDGQTVNYTALHFTNKDGLPQNSIIDMLLDKNGFLWMTTQDGICRYDGKQFRIFNMKNTPGIAFNRFNLMMATKNNSIVLWQQCDKDNFFTVTPEENILKDTTFTVAKYWDLAVYNINFSTKGVHTLWSCGDDKFMTNKYEGYYYTKHGLIYFDLNNKTKSEKLIGQGGILNPIVVGDIFLSNEAGKKSEAYENGDKLDYWPCNKDVTDLLNKCKSPTVNSFWSKKKEYTILFTGENIYLLFLQNGQIKSRLLFHNFPFTKNWAENINQLEYDNTSGNLFIGSNVQGLYVLKPTKFCHFDANPSLTSVGSQIMLDNGDILNSHIRYNLHTGKYSPANPVTTYVQAFFKDEKGVVYFSNGSKIYKAGKNFDNFKLIGLVKFMGSQFQSFMKDASGQLWFNDMSNLGIIKNDSIIYKYKNSAKFNKLNYIQSIFEKGKDTLWILSLLNIYTYTPSNNMLNTQPIISGIIPRNVFKARDSSTWIGTYGHGFYKYANGKFIAMPLDEAGYLLNAHSFYEDNNGFFWIPTNNGLFQCRKKDLDDYAAGKLQHPYYYHYNSTDGFATDEFNGGFTPAYLVNKGEITYASMDGVVHFYPDSIHPLLPMAPVFIDQITIDGKNYKPTDTITIAHSFSQLKIKTTSAFYGNVENLIMHYRLEGLNNNWISINYGENILFNSLPTGDYTFVIRKQNGFGRNNYSYKKFSFTVLPFWYETWWSKLTVLLVITAIIAFIFSLRLKANKRRAAMELMLTEQQLKALRAQINPHFLQNTFTFLAHQIGSAPRDKAIDTIHKLSAYLRHVLHLSDKSVTSLENELLFVEEYLQMQQSLMRLPFEYKMAIMEEVDVFDIQVPTMLIQPLVENALKYGFRYWKER